MFSAKCVYGGVDAVVDKCYGPASVSMPGYTADGKCQRTKHASRVTYEGTSSRDRVEDAVDPEACVIHG